MKHQLIAAMGLTALMAWCGYQIAQEHPPGKGQRQPSAIEEATTITP